MNVETCSISFYKQIFTYRNKKKNALLTRGGIKISIGDEFISINHKL